MKINKQSIVLLIILVSCISFVIYLKALQSEFVWDDVQLITHPLNIKNNPYSFFLGGGIYYRPILSLFMLIDFSFWHLNPIGYHLTNILLHIINSLLVFILSFYLLKNNQISKTENIANIRFFEKPFIVSLLASILFAVHPIHTESVAWISGRTDILSTLFLLLAFLSFATYEKEDKKISLFLTGFFFLFSLLSKENGIALIGVVFIYGLIKKMSPKKLLLSLFVLFTVFLLYLFLRHGGGYVEFTANPGSKEAFFSSGISINNFFKILFLGIGLYFQKLTIPLNLNLLPEIPSSSIYYIIFLLPFILGTIFYIKKIKTEVFLLAWIIITLLPSLSILYTQITPAPIGERYLYMPSVGFCILVPLILFRSHLKKLSLIFLLGLIISFSIFTYQRVQVWKNDLTLWEDTVRKNPHSVTAITNYGYSLMKNKEYDKAKEQFITALKQKRMSYAQISTILNLLGVQSMEQKHFQEAEEYFLKALKADFKNSTVYNNLGYLYLQMSDKENSSVSQKELIEKAIINFDKALVFSPNFLPPKFNKALCFLKKKDYEKAEYYFNLVVQSDPLHKLSQDSLQFLLFIKLLKVQNK